MSAFVGLFGALRTKGNFSATSTGNFLTVAGHNSRRFICAMSHFGQLGSLGALHYQVWANSAQQNIYSLRHGTIRDASLALLAILCAPGHTMYRALQGSSPYEESLVLREFSGNFHATGNFHGRETDGRIIADCKFKSDAVMLERAERIFDSSWSYPP
jgi:hypothetical protein